MKRMGEASAFCPAGISSFFQICDEEADGRPIKDPERIGARGGGFALSKGVFTEVRAVASKESNIQIFINDKATCEAETTKTVAEMMLDRVDESYSLTIKHRVEVPIGAGFGSSAAGALTTALALSKALNIHLTYNQIGKIAHVAEVLCKTGLGTVGPLMIGGCVITVEPGAPGYALIDRISISPNYKVIAGTFQPKLTKEFLSHVGRKKTINELGGKTVKAILEDPSLENFLHLSKEFALKTGLTSERCVRLMEEAEKAGAIGAAQNMVGEAVHAVVEAEKLGNVLKVFERFLPRNKIIVADIDFQGVKLVDGGHGEV